MLVAAYESWLPPSIELRGELGDFGGLFAGEVLFLGGVGFEVVEFNDVVGLVGFVGDDELAMAINDPAPAEAGGRDLEIDEVVGEALAVEGLAGGDGGVVEEVHSGHVGGGFETGGFEDGGGEVERAGKVV